MTRRFFTVILKAILVLIVFIPSQTSGQSPISDTLFYSLARQTVQKLELTDLNVFHQVVRPLYLMDTANNVLKNTGYFTDDDIASAAGQINRPVVLTWDNDLFKHDLNVTLVKEYTKDNCMYISLPLVTHDGNAIIIYYEIWSGRKKNRSVFAGATLWARNISDEWTFQKDSPLWRQ